MEPLIARSKAYEWGSTTALEHALGRVVEKPGSVAELWFGAHASDSSVLHTGDRLINAIQSDPVSALGPNAKRRFGDELPFLMKILSAGSPLSLQAHPTKAQAREGFERENLLEIPLDSSRRTYRDRNHKPELLVALAPFEALIGFRDAQQTVSLIDGVSLPGLRIIRDALTGRPGPVGFKDALAAIFALSGDVVAETIGDVASRFREWLHEPGQHHHWSKTAATFIQLSELYPDDPGVLVSIMLNRVSLEVGEGVFLPAGVLHSYLSGVGIEVMANSDNVLRGGLSRKPLDPDGLISVLSYEAGAAGLIRPSPSIRLPGVDSYRQPAEEFALSRVRLSDGTAILRHRGPRILVCTSGTMECTSASGANACVEAGEAVWAPASDETLKLKAVTASAECFITSIP